MCNYFVIYREQCSACDGNGMVANEIWLRFYQEQREAGIDFDENLWARDNGFGSAKAMGQEEYECHECEGSGKIVREVSLVDALVELSVLA